MPSVTTVAHAATLSAGVLHTPMLLLQEVNTCWVPAIFAAPAALTESPLVQMPMPAAVAAAEQCRTMLPGWTPT